jgi:hypothetical protein
MAHVESGRPCIADLVVMERCKGASAGSEPTDRIRFSGVGSRANLVAGTADRPLRGIGHMRETSHKVAIAACVSHCERGVVSADAGLQMLAHLLITLL